MLTNLVPILMLATRGLGFHRYPCETKECCDSTLHTQWVCLVNDPNKCECKINPTSIMIPRRELTFEDCYIELLKERIKSLKKGPCR